MQSWGRLTILTMDYIHHGNLKRSVAFVAMETCLLHGVVSGRQYSNPYQVGTIVSTANSSFLKSLAAVSEIKN